MWEQPRDNAPAQIPTSGPWDSAKLVGEDEYAAIYAANYALYDTRTYIPGPPTIQPALISTAPHHLSLNPDWRNFQAAPQPYQAPVGAAGAPAIPWSDPGYVSYQVQARIANHYYEYVGGKAPAITSAVDGACK